MSSASSDYPSSSSYLSVLTSVTMGLNDLVVSVVVVVVSDMVMVFMVAFFVVVAV